jgi:hypothetical protein
MHTLRDSIPIPPQLEDTVEQAIQRGQHRKRRKIWPRAAATAASICLLLVAVGRVNPTMATALSNVPVLGALYRVFTYSHSEEQQPTYHANIRIPHVDGDAVPGDEPWVQSINETISRTMEEEYRISKERAEEYYQAFVETGGDPADFMPLDIYIDYQVKHSSEKYLSFVVFKLDTMASAYQQSYYYNFDVESGKPITLETLMGENWKTQVADQVRQQLAAFSEEQKQMLFPEVQVEDCLTAEQFYLNAQGQVVVVFNKYQLGAGALGMLEFPLDITP